MDIKELKEKRDELAEQIPTLEKQYNANLNILAGKKLALEELIREMEEGEKSKNPGKPAAGSPKKEEKK